MKRKSIYKGIVYSVISLDVEKKEVTLETVGTINLSDKDLKLIFNINDRIIGI